VYELVDECLFCWAEVLYGKAKGGPLYLLVLRANPNEFFGKVCMVNWEGSGITQ